MKLTPRQRQTLALAGVTTQPAHRLIELLPLLIPVNVPDLERHIVAKTLCELRDGGWIESKQQWRPSGARVHWRPTEKLRKLLPGFFEEPPACLPSAAVVASSIALVLLTLCACRGPGIPLTDGEIIDGEIPGCMGAQMSGGLRGWLLNSPPENIAVVFFDLGALAVLVTLVLARLLRARNLRRDSQCAQQARKSRASTFYNAGSVATEVATLIGGVAGAILFALAIVPVLRDAGGPLLMGCMTLAVLGAAGITALLSRVLIRR